MGSSRKWLKFIGGKKRLSCEAALANEKPRRRWRWWSSFCAIMKKPSAVCGDGCRQKGICNGADLREDSAAIRIQTAFRAFLARRALRALRGLVRLQAAINGHDARKQSAASLRCIQAFVRVQARIHRQCAVKNRDALDMHLETALAGHTALICRTDSETDWCNALGTLEEIQAKEQQRQVAAIKRERAIAYAFCNKWKANAKLNPDSLFDYELENSTWSWIWLDQWLNGGTINNRHQLANEGVKQGKQGPETVPIGRKKVGLKTGAGSSRKMKARITTKSIGGRKATVDESEGGSKKALTKEGSVQQSEKVNGNEEQYDTKLQAKHQMKQHSNQPTQEP